MGDCSFHSVRVQKTNVVSGNLLGDIGGEYLNWDPFSAGGSYPVRSSATLGYNQAHSPRVPAEQTSCAIGGVS